MALVYIATGDHMSYGTYNSLKELDKRGLIKLGDCISYKLHNYYDEMEGDMLYEESFEVEYSETFDGCQIFECGYAYELLRMLKVKTKVFTKGA